MIVNASGRVVINENSLQAILNSPNGPIYRDLLRRGRNVETRAKQLCPVATGRLRSTIGPPIPTTIGGRPAVLVGSILEYAAAQELGWNAGKGDNSHFVQGRHFLLEGLKAATV